jgi:cell fate (sporulation/competence/biofilm development) regulator YlbF (YheA/YmcA/DUF963 family)
MSPKMSKTCHRLEESIRDVRNRSSPDSVTTGDDYIRDSIAPRLAEIEQLDASQRIDAYRTMGDELKRIVNHWGVDQFRINEEHRQADAEQQARELQKCYMVKYQALGELIGTLNPRWGVCRQIMTQVSRAVDQLLIHPDIKARIDGLCELIKLVNKEIDAKPFIIELYD